VTQRGKSDFLSSAEDMKERLGDALCLAKWQQTSIHLTNGYTNSCYHPPLHRIDADAIKDNPSALHNTYHKKQQREKMLRGERPEECSYCWRVEATGNLSDRHYRSGEPWAAAAFDEILVRDPLTWDVNPAYVEINFSNVCNLKCSYCSPQFSSAWQKEINEHGAYPTSNRHNSPEYFAGDRRVIPNRDENPYLEAFWRWWPELYTELKHFRMTGGEPIMDKNTYRVFDYVLAHPKSDLILNVTSNFSQEDFLFDKYLDKVKQITQGDCVDHFMQFVSVDGWGQQAEYIRHGMDFVKVMRNVETFLKQAPHRTSLTFIITMSNLNISSLKSLLNWILMLRETHSTDRQHIWFDTPILRQPEWQCLNIMPEAYAWKLQQIVDWMREHLETEAEPYKGFKDYEVQRLQRVVDWMRKERKDDRKAKADFYRFFNEHDRRRNTDFAKTFTEMTEWWDECRYWSDNE
jgi:organic radical activating enzyme